MTERAVGASPTLKEVVYAEEKEGLGKRIPIMVGIGLNYCSYSPGLIDYIRLNYTESTRIYNASNPSKKAESSQ